MESHRYSKRSSLYAEGHGDRGSTVPGGLQLGISGVEARLGDHICCLYSGESQRDQVLIPFLQSGLMSGDKCICVVDGTDPAHIVATLGGTVDATALTATKQLEVIRAADMYLRSGKFLADEVIGSWKATMSDVMYDGRFDVVRAVETWSRRDVVPDMQELMLLESEMNRYLPLYPQVIVCMYDLDRFGAGLVVDLLKTHPRIMVGGMLVENPYHLTPDELLNTMRRGESDELNVEINEAARWYFGATTG